MLGLVEVERPADLAARGGAWFRTLDGGRVVVELRVGVEDAFAPARQRLHAFDGHGNRVELLA